jgi:hypothetical protein
MKTKEIDARQIRTIKFPPALRRGKVFVIEGKDLIMFKKMESPALSEVRQKLKSIKGKITETEINQEIQNYRKGK